MLNNMMLSHALYIEHMNPSALLEGIRQAINEDEKPPLTTAQVHDLWNDKTITVERAKRDGGTPKDGKSSAKRKRGL